MEEKWKRRQFNVKILVSSNDGVRTLEDFEAMRSSDVPMGTVSDDDLLHYMTNGMMDVLVNGGIASTTLFSHDLPAIKRSNPALKVHTFLQFLSDTIPLSYTQNNIRNAISTFSHATRKLVVRGRLFFPYSKIINPSGRKDLAENVHAIEDMCLRLPGNILKGMHLAEEKRIKRTERRRAFESQVVKRTQNMHARLGQWEENKLFSFSVSPVKGFSGELAGASRPENVHLTVPEGALFSNAFRAEKLEPFTPETLWVGGDEDSFPKNREESERLVQLKNNVILPSDPLCPSYESEFFTLVFAVLAVECMYMTPHLEGQFALLSNKPRAIENFHDVLRSDMFYDRRHNYAAYFFRLYPGILAEAMTEEEFEAHCEKQEGLVRDNYEKFGYVSGSAASYNANVPIFFRDQGFAVNVHIYALMRAVFSVLTITKWRMRVPHLSCIPPMVIHIIASCGLDAYREFFAPSFSVVHREDMAPSENLNMNNIWCVRSALTYARRGYFTEDDISLSSPEFPYIPIENVLKRMTPSRTDREPGILRPDYRYPFSCISMLNSSMREFETDMPDFQDRFAKFMVNARKGWLWDDVLNLYPKEDRKEARRILTNAWVYIAVKETFMYDGDRMPAYGTNSFNLLWSHAVLEFVNENIGETNMAHLYDNMHGKSNEAKLFHVIQAVRALVTLIRILSDIRVFEKSLGKATWVINKHVMDGVRLRPSLIGAFYFVVDNHTDIMFNWRSRVTAISWANMNRESVSWTPVEAYTRVGEGNIVCLIESLLWQDLANDAADISSMLNRFRADGKQNELAVLTSHKVPNARTAKNEIMRVAATMKETFKTAEHIENNLRVVIVSMTIMYVISTSSAIYELCAILALDGFRYNRETRLRNMTGESSGLGHLITKGICFGTATTVAYSLKALCSLICSTRNPVLETTDTFSPLAKYHYTGRFPAYVHMLMEKAVQDKAYNHEETYEYICSTVFNPSSTCLFARNMRKCLNIRASNVLNAILAFMCIDKPHFVTHTTMARICEMPVSNAFKERHRELFAFAKYIADGPAPNERVLDTMEPVKVFYVDIVYNSILETHTFLPSVEKYTHGNCYTPLGFSITEAAEIEGQNTEAFFSSIIRRSIRELIYRTRAILKAYSQKYTEFNIPTVKPMSGSESRKLKKHFEMIEKLDDMSDSDSDGEPSRPASKKKKTKKINYDDTDEEDNGNKRKKKRVMNNRVYLNGDNAHGNYIRSVGCAMHVLLYNMILDSELDIETRSTLAKTITIYSSNTTHSYTLVPATAVIKKNMQIVPTCSETSMFVYPKDVESEYETTRNIVIYGNPGSRVQSNQVKTETSNMVAGFTYVGRSEDAVQKAIENSKPPRPCIESTANLIAVLERMFYYVMPARPLSDDEEEEEAKEEKARSGDDDDDDDDEMQQQDSAEQKMSKSDRIALQEYGTTKDTLHLSIDNGMFSIDSKALVFENSPVASVYTSLDSKHTLEESIVLPANVDKMHANRTLTEEEFFDRKERSIATRVRQASAPKKRKKPPVDEKNAAHLIATYKKDRYRYLKSNLDDPLPNSNKQKQDTRDNVLLDLSKRKWNFVLRQSYNEMTYYLEALEREMAPPDPGCLATLSESDGFFNIAMRVLFDIEIESGMRPHTDVYEPPDYPPDNQFNPVPHMNFDTLEEHMQFHRDLHAEFLDSNEKTLRKQNKEIFKEDSVDFSSAHNEHLCSNSETSQDSDYFVDETERNSLAYKHRHDPIFREILPESDTEGSHKRYTIYPKQRMRGIFNSDHSDHDTRYPQNAAALDFSSDVKFRQHRCHLCKRSIETEQLDAFMAITGSCINPTVLLNKDSLNRYVHMHCAFPDTFTRIGSTDHLVLRSRKDNALVSIMNPITNRKTIKVTMNPPDMKSISTLFT